MPPKRLCLILATVVWLFASPVRAWDETGHQVIAYIAWQHMTPEARAGVMDVLAHAPWQSDLLDLFPQDSRPLATRQMAYFLAASTWPDIVRDRDKRARWEKYHRGNWHYINFFWEEDPDGTIREREDMQPAETNAVERLAYLERVAGSGFFTRAQRAVAVAWLEHLAGDIHQPLHTSGRVTGTEPEGDQGGNLFKLDGRHTLHGYWDNVIELTRPRRPGEKDLAYVERIGREIMNRYPAGEFQTEAGDFDYERWAKRGYTLARTEVYEGVDRGHAPSDAYEEKARSIAEPAAALAGYRLAALMNRIFG